MSFVDQYEQAAPLYGMTPQELADRDRIGAGRRRWLAADGGVVVAAVDVLVRSDDRALLSFVGDNRAAWSPLTVAVREVIGRPVLSSVDANDVGAVVTLEAAGFDVELEHEAFRVRFDDALGWLRRAWMPTGMSLHPADRVDEERLFVLDTTVRQDVPGTDGWRGDREWFREELAEAPPFDPTGYVVAVDDRTGGYVGLCRMWRNREGPRLGLIGVLRRYRATTIASALLRQTLIGAAGWGWETFTTEASVSNRHTHPRLVRIAAERTGRSLQMIHP